LGTEENGEKEAQSSVHGLRYQRRCLPSCCQFFFFFFLSCFPLFVSQSFFFLLLLWVHIIGVMLTITSWSAEIVVLFSLTSFPSLTLCVCIINCIWFLIELFMKWNFWLQRQFSLSACICTYVVWHYLLPIFYFMVRLSWKVCIELLLIAGHCCSFCVWPEPIRCHVNNSFGTRGLHFKHLPKV